MPGVFKVVPVSWQDSTRRFISDSPIKPCNDKTYSTASVLDCRHDVISRFTRSTSLHVEKYQSIAVRTPQTGIACQTDTTNSKTRQGQNKATTIQLRSIDSDPWVPARVSQASSEVDQLIFLSRPTGTFQLFHSCAPAASSLTLRSSFRERGVMLDVFCTSSLYSPVGVLITSKASALPSGTSSLLPDSHFGHFGLRQMPWSDGAHKQATYSSIDVSETVICESAVLVAFTSFNSTTGRGTTQCGGSPNNTIHRHSHSNKEPLPSLLQLYSITSVREVSESTLPYWISIDALCKTSWVTVEKECRNEFLISFLCILHKNTTS